jgi:glycosyltransferase involved in cell wall biosynthesis
VARDWALAGFTRGDESHHIAYWAYEIENFLPEEFAAAAPVMAEIWTPSRFCHRVFSHTCLPVHVVPHAVPFAEELADLPFARKQAPFTVLYLFDAWSRLERKNPQAAIQVFQNAFPRRHDVRLVLKGHHLSPEECEQLYAACNWDSRITVLNKFLSATELDDLFANADVLLSLQRGEGFGLNIAKSLGMGLPVITTGWGGQLDFCQPDNCMLVPYRLKAVAYEGEYAHHEGIWAEPDQKAAAVMLAKMEKLVATNDPTLLVMRENGRSLIASDFSQEALNRTIAGRIKEVLAASRNRT